MVGEKFVEGATIDGVKISSLGENFKKNFIGVREENVKLITAQQRKLLRSATNREVYTARAGTGMNALGKSSIALAHIWEFLKTAGHDEWYLFFSHGWAVDGYWRDDGWLFEARPLDDPGRWRGGDQFLSR